MKINKDGAHEPQELENTVQKKKKQFYNFLSTNALLDRLLDYYINIYYYTCPLRDFYWCILFFILIFYTFVIVPAAIVFRSCPPLLYIVL